MGRIPGHAKEKCIKLFERVLGARAHREHTFDFLRGDQTPKRPQGSRLPVDAYFAEYSLVLEYLGEQHFEDNPLMNRRPGRLEQRPRYVQRRLEVLPQHGIKVICVRYDEPMTEEHVRCKLKEAGIQVPGP